MCNVDNDLAETDIEDMIKEADSNGDGKIDFDEFTKMMQHQKWIFKSHVIQKGRSFKSGFSATHSMFEFSITCESI